MARIPYLDKTTLRPEHHDVLSRDIALMRALAHSPDAARAMSGLGRFIRETSRLDPRLRELAILQVGYLEGAAERVVDLTITIAFYCAVVRVLATLEIDLEEDYQALLERFPLRGRIPR